MIRKSIKNKAVTGRREKNSFKPLTNAFINHKSIEKTAFRIYKQKLMAVLIAIDRIEIIS